MLFHVAEMKVGPHFPAVIPQVEESIYIGDDQLDALSSIKSREELIGDLIFLLQSPARNVLSALQSGNTKLAGIVKTLSEKESLVITD